MELRAFLAFARHPADTTYVIDIAGSPRVSMVIPATDPPPARHLQRRIHAILGAGGIPVRCTGGEPHEPAEHCAVGSDALCSGSASLPTFLEPLHRRAVAEGRGLAMIACGTPGRVDRLSDLEGALDLEGMSWDEMNAALEAFGAKVQDVAGVRLVVVRSNADPVPGNGADDGSPPGP